MRRMLQPVLDDHKMRRKTSSLKMESETTDIELVQSIFKASMKDNWVPGQPTMTLDDHYAVVNRLRGMESKSRTAATAE